MAPERGEGRQMAADISDGKAYAAGLCVYRYSIMVLHRNGHWEEER